MEDLMNVQDLIDELEERGIDPAKTFVNAKKVFRPVDLSDDDDPDEI